MPFRWTFMVDGKTMADKYKDDVQVIEESERLKSWYVWHDQSVAKNGEAVSRMVRSIHS